MISSIVSETDYRKIGAEQLVDGLDMHSTNFRGSTSLFQELAKLINFDVIEFQCQHRNSSGTFHYCFGNKIYLNVAKYFANDSNTRPRMSSFYSQSEMIGLSPVENLLSDEGINPEERVYKNIFRTTDGLNLTFADDSKQCFSAPGDDGQWDYFQVILK